MPVLKDVADMADWAIDKGRRILDLWGKVREVELKQEMVELQDQLVDMKARIVTLKEEKLRLAEEVTRLRERPTLRANIELRDGAYFLKSTSQGQSPGPYCPRCFQVNNEQLIPLGEHHGEFTFIEGRWLCPNCNKSFGPKVML